MPRAGRREVGRAAEEDDVERERLSRRERWRVEDRVDGGGDGEGNGGGEKIGDLPFASFSL